MDKKEKDNGYLVIKRRVGQSIIIHGIIEVIVHRMSDGQVQIAIKAPREIDVARKELFDRGQSSKDKADKQS